jgi:hypothetical protein
MRPSLHPGTLAVAVVELVRPASPLVKRLDLRTGENGITIPLQPPSAPSPSTRAHYNNRVSCPESGEAPRDDFIFDSEAHPL